MNKLFFVINTNTLFRKWITKDITHVELYSNGEIIGSYGGIDQNFSYHKIEYLNNRGFMGTAYIPENIIRAKTMPAVTFMLGSFLCFLLTGLALSVYFS
jgi:hypothetical protein